MILFSYHVIILSSAIMVRRSIFHFFLCKVWPRLLCTRWSKIKGPNIHKHFLFSLSTFIWILQNVNCRNLYNETCTTRASQFARFYFASRLSVTLCDATRSTCGADKETSTVDPVKRKAWIINERLQRAMVEQRTLFKWYRINGRSKRRRKKERARERGERENSRLIPGEN